MSVKDSQELVEFLKDNLRVVVGSSDGGAYSSAEITVELYIGRVLISSGSCQLPEQSDRY